MQRGSRSQTPVVKKSEFVALRLKISADLWKGHFLTILVLASDIIRSMLDLAFDEAQEVLLVHAGRCVDVSIHLVVRNENSITWPSTQRSHALPCGNCRSRGEALPFDWRIHGVRLIVCVVGIWKIGKRGDGKRMISCEWQESAIKNFITKLIVKSQKLKTPYII